MVLPDSPNQRWSLDFVSDSLVCGRRLRILSLFDDFSPESPALVADKSLSVARVVRETSLAMTERRSGRIIGADRISVGYCSTRDFDAGLRYEMC